MKVIKWRVKLGMYVSRDIRVLVGERRVKSGW